ncbi:hypothetical protein G7Y89_g2514 [Cudoniella acicularis]|uniref:Amino acid permease/ SLC12A domain-containing protein n=1 Tax=Cudoniella acicularis TaxID=354080 RepID=A0A8H4W9A2_9HELO|nr:hypothetical protein G7Y89_g2514 [Cudoniella acicularis]
MAVNGHAPVIFKRINRFGITYVAVALYGVFMCLGYMTLSSNASTVFTWLQDIVSISTLVSWISICLVYLRFYCGCEKLGIDPKTELPWAAPLQLYTTWMSFVLFVLLPFTGGYTTFIHGEWSDETFISSYLNIPLILVFYFGFKWWKNTKIVSLEEMPIQGFIELRKNNPEPEPQPKKGLQKLNILGSVLCDINSTPAQLDLATIFQNLRPSVKVINMAKGKHVVFDIVGTCVSFDAYETSIANAIGPKLLAHNITPKFFSYSWMTGAELEFTFLSISERYKPYKEILKAMFYRTLWMAGISDPRALVTEEERNLCIQGYSELKLRPGAAECFAKLRSAGFTVWCLTTADLKRVQGYFEKGGVDMPVEKFISCDSTGLAKPALGAYMPALAQFEKGDEKWFAAAHMWDVSAAVKVGFRGAYCSEYEKEACLEIFDTKMDVIADTLPEMADKIIKASK